MIFKLKSRQGNRLIYLEKRYEIEAESLEDAVRIFKELHPDEEILEVTKYE